MRKLSYSITLVLTIAVFFLTSCHRDLDVAPIATYNGKATHTIAQLLEYHQLTGNTSYDTLPDGIVIQGIVISSDKEGNCYKSLTIDDGTAGLQIKIDGKSLYKNYPLGQQIFVKCDGFVLGEYGMLYQLGWCENEEVIGINTNVLYRCIFRNGVPGNTPEPIELTSANQIQDYMYSRLVRIKNVHFTSPGRLFAATSAPADQSQEITFEDGTKITLYTSSYANFARQSTPEGVFDMVAILSRYRTTNQLTLRSLSDMTTPIVPPTATEVVVSSMNLSQNPLDNGWICKTLAGSSWEYVANKASMKIVGTASNNDSWLISPSINASNYDNLKLIFEHRSIGGSANRQVYYSTTYTGGDINENEWHSLNVNNFSNETTTYAAYLPEELLSASNLRIAFRYYDNTTSTWLLSQFKVSTIVEQ